MLCCVCDLVPQCFAVQLSGWALRVSDIGRGSTECYDLDARVRGHGRVVPAEIGDIPFQSTRAGEVEILTPQCVESLHHHRGDFHGERAKRGVLEVRQSRAVQWPSFHRTVSVFVPSATASKYLAWNLSSRLGSESGCR